MFKRSILTYRRALYALLHEYPTGLSAVDIADKLTISDVECESLLKQEELRGAIDVSLINETGNIIYISKKNIEPQLSLKQELETINSKQAFIPIIGIALACIVLIGFLFNSNHQLINQSQQDNIDQHSFISIDNRVDAKVARNKLIALQRARDELNERLNRFQLIADKQKCNLNWNKGEACYLEGRLLSKVQFDRELAEMKLDISQHDELLNL